jgi:hypothetical protein
MSGLLQLDRKRSFRFLALRTSIGAHLARARHCAPSCAADSRSRARERLCWPRRSARPVRARPARRFAPFVPGDAWARVPAGSRSRARVASRDENLETAMARIDGDPHFVRRADVLAATDNDCLNAFAAVAGNAFDVEDGDRHTHRCRRSWRWTGSRSKRSTTNGPGAGAATGL